MSKPFPPVCLTIGTSDSSGGAGIQVDLKTFAAHDCYGASVITAATAQNFTGIKDMHVLPENFVRSQLEAVAEELPIAAVKVGLCPHVATIRVIGRWLREHRDIPVVVDPVVADSRGIALVQPEEMEALRKELLPRATVITPNRFQAAMLTGMDECLGQEACEDAARTIFHRYGCPAVITGGGLGESRDIFVGLDGLRHFEGSQQRAQGKVYGRGSTFSAAITAGLASGWDLRESILHARMYVSAAIAAAPLLPNGRGPMWHNVQVTEQITSGAFKIL